MRVFSQAKKWLLALPRLSQISFSLDNANTDPYPLFNDPNFMQEKFTKAQAIKISLSELFLRDVQLPDIEL